MAIHSRAIISPKAELDPTVEVGPNAIIEEHVRIGAGTRVWGNAYITGHTEIGRNNEIHMGAVIGHEPQDLKFKRDCLSYLRIGDGNVFREGCSIHRGTEPESSTVIGNNCLFMAASHVGHNCVVGNHVILCNCALLGGHVHLGDRSFLSGCVTVHQFIHIGRLVMLSGNTSISMDVPPFLTVARRNEVHGLNLVGLRRAKINPSAITEIKRLYKLFYRSGVTLSRALSEALSDGTFTQPESREFIEFVKNSPNGVCSAPKGYIPRESSVDRVE
jgi:UDP-N-acetylglucosamine acyltransferase